VYFWEEGRTNMPWVAYMSGQGGYSPFTVTFDWQKSWIDNQNPMALDLEQVFD
jgi:hypothetical protein